MIRSVLASNEKIFESPESIRTADRSAETAESSRVAEFVSASIERTIYKLTVIRKKTGKKGKNGIMIVSRSCNKRKKVNEL